MQLSVWGMSWILIYKVGNVNNNQFCKFCHGYGIVYSLCIVALQITVSRAFGSVTGISKVYSDLSCKFPNILLDCNQILILLMDFNKSPHYKISWKFVQWETGWYMWTDMMKLWGAFREYVKILGVRFTVKLNFLLHRKYTDATHSIVIFWRLCLIRLCC